MRCPKADSVRLVAVARKLERVYGRDCTSAMCRAEHRHIHADMKEAQKLLRQQKCMDAAVVMDHLEWLARKRH